MKWLLIVAIAVFILVLWRVVIASASRLPKVGDAAPGFSLPDQNGRTHTLEDFRGGYLALYFFPRADTPGWTEQAARFRDAAQEIQRLGAAVCGVSVDGVERLAKFADKYRLPFALLSDPRGNVAGRYGSLLNLVLMKVARRNTFLIDAQGRIAKRYLGVNPAGNAAEVIADLRKLQPRS